MPQVNPQAPSSTESAAREAGKEPRADLSAQVQEKTQQAAGQAQEKAQQVAGQLQDRVRAQIDQRSSEVAEQIKEQGSDLRSVAETLRQQDKEGPAKAAERLAGYAEQAADYLNGKDSHALLADMEELGRRRPWAAGAGGLVLGFVASRFLKASSGERYRARPARQSPLPERSTGSGQDRSDYAGPGTVTPGAAPGVL